MGRQLITTVLVAAPPGGNQTFATFGPEDEDVPDWALEQMGEHCFADNGDDEKAEKPTRRAAKK